jgi:hypothetical protein
MAELRMFMDTAYLHHVEFDRFVAESHGIPDVKLGLSTSGGGFSDGWDLWKAAKILTCMIRQHTGDREKYSSWRRPDMVLGRWAGGYYPDCVTTGRFMPWHQLFHGSTVYATWCSGIGNDMSIWRADGGMRDGIAASATELREIWSGPATLIRNSQRVPPLVGIHYSRASQMASAAEWWGATWGAADALEAGLEVLGHQFRYISYEEVEQGFCDTWPGKCIYLPVSICLSRAEVDALRRFAEQGGTLIADCDGGTRDAYGGVAGPGQLADVLGCEWVPAPALAKGQKLAITLNVPGVPQELPLDQGYRRIATLTTGKPQGTIHYGDQEFPAWIVHPFGRGQAITLNFLPARTAQGWAILRALLAAAGVKHPIDVTRDGKEILYVERFGFEDSGALYSAIMDFVKLRDGWGRLYLSPEERQPIPGVAVTFPRKAHLYDVRTKKYHGEADSLSSELEPAKAYLFAHLPYKVDGLAVDFPGTTSVTSGGRVSFQVAHAGGTSVPHSIRLQVFDPSGRERPEYGRVTRFPEGKGELEVPLAPNDPTGVWKVVASETISGISVEKPWEVKP